MYIFSIIPTLVSLPKGNAPLPTVPLPTPDPGQLPQVPLPPDHPTGGVLGRQLGQPGHLRLLLLQPRGALLRGEAEVGEEAARCPARPAGHSHVQPAGGLKGNLQYKCASNISVTEILMCLKH